MTYLIAFDFDGVIADSWEAHLRAYIKNFEYFGRRFPIRTHRGWRRYYDSAWENNYLKNGFRRSELPAVLENYDQYLTYRGVRLFSGIDQVIRKLSSDFNLVVVSTTTKSLIEEKLKESKLDSYFEDIVGGEGVSDKSELLKRSLQITGVAPSRAVIIGDSPSDIKAGRKVGTKTIGVTYGWISASRIKALRPDLLVGAVRELTNAVDELF